MSAVESPRIETARLVLSPYSAADADALVENAGRPEVAQMLETIPLPFTRAEALGRIERRPCNIERFTLAIRHRESGRMIGEVAAGSGPRGGIAGMGYHLHPDFWGQGIISEAVEAALHHAFRTLGWFVIEADAFDENAASVRVLEKFGFQPVGESNCQSAAREETAAGTAYRLYRNRWATPVLSTPRLTLRAPGHRDAAPLQALLDTPEVARMLTPVPLPYTLEMARAFVSGGLGDPDDLDFAIEGPQGVMGMISLPYLGPVERRIGFWLGAPYWRQGFMEEAARAVLQHAFGTAGVERLYSSAFFDNEPSQALHEKLGFTAGMRETEFSRARGEAVEVITYTLDRKAWEMRA